MEDSQFRLDDGSWGLNTYPGSSEGTLNQDSGTGAISVTTSGANFWEVTMVQASIHLVANKDYLLDFDGMASALGKSVNVKTKQGSSPYDTVFEEEVGLHQSLTPTRLAFNSGSYVGEMILDFQVGGQGNSDFEFDNVSLQDQLCGKVVRVIDTAPRDHREEEIQE